MTPIESATNPTLSLLTRVISQRSAPHAGARAPTPVEVAWLLRAATTVPDHGSLRPWRFIVMTGDVRFRFGQALVSDVIEAKGDLPQSVIDKVRAKAFAAPTQIVLIASPDLASNIAEWEQVASASCCGYAIVLVAHAIGLAAIWKSTPYRDGPAIKTLLQITQHEQWLGWINVGGNDSGAALGPRPVPDLAAVTRVLGVDGLDPYGGPESAKGFDFDSTDAVDADSE